jgi:hypothetical protein
MYEAYKQWTTSCVYAQGNELQRQLIETDTDWYLQNSTQIGLVFFSQLNNALMLPKEMY